MSVDKRTMGNKSIHVTHDRVLIPFTVYYNIKISTFLELSKFQNSTFLILMENITGSYSLFY